MSRSLVAAPERPRIEPQRKEFDYVIVGAGSAGCVLAARLSANKGLSVCLIEAGGSDRNITIKMPAALTLPIESDRYNWKFETEPEPCLAGRRLGQARGKGLGGSSSINGMVFARGNPRDFDGWAEHGLKNWSFERCLPYFIKMETYHGEQSPLRGQSGPISVVRSPAAHPFYEAYLEAGQQAGQPLAADYNGDSQAGVHVTQVTIKNGVRCSTAAAYLHPVMSRANLTVLTNAVVERVLFDRRRAYGVKYERKKRNSIVIARREVVLCAGAIGSPQILLLSGVGDESQLTELGIDLVEHLPGVGANLQDHVVAPLRYSSKEGYSLRSSLGPIGRLTLGVQWILTRKGLGASNFFEVGSFFKSSEDVGYPNMQHEFLPFLADFQSGRVVLGDGFQYFVSQMRPRSRGHVRLKSRDLHVRPQIVFNYLSRDQDVLEMVKGIKFTREAARQRAWDRFRLRELDPGPEVQSDTEIGAWLRSVANTEHHPAGTCAMGLDQSAVTDEAGRVHGVDALRVVDASVFPLIPSGNINAAVIMLAEKISDEMVNGVR